MISNDLPVGTSIEYIGPSAGSPEAPTTATIIPTPTELPPEASDYPTLMQMLGDGIPYIWVMDDKADPNGYIGPRPIMVNGFWRVVVLEEV